jgi:hypothetical protein
VFYLNMSFIGKFVMVLGIGCLLSATIKAADMDSGNPYNAVVVRNIFGLMPIPTNAPVAPPSDPPPKITPNGIMNLLGDLQVLFKVAIPPRPGQPPHDQSYVLSEGERQDDIEVVKIDEKAAMITFNNHGVTQELPLANAPNVSTPGFSGPMRGGGANFPRPLGGRFGQSRNLGNFQGANNSSYSSNYGAANTPPNNNNGPTGPSANNNLQYQQLSPEAQVLMMEANRANLQSQSSPIANLIPRTVVTPPDGNGNAPSPP